MFTTTSNDGTTIAYETVGEGSPLVLVGGAFNDRRSPSAGLPLAAQLAGHHAVVGYDRRGRGDSGDTHPYAPEREVEDLAAVIAAAGGSAAVFGHSSGAALALRAAAAGAGVTSLVLFEPPFTAPDLAAAGNEALRRRLEDLVCAGRRGDAVETFQRAIGIPDEIVTGLRDAPFRPALEAIAHTLPYDLAVIGPGTVPTDVLKQVQVPMLVVVGSSSPGPLVAAGGAVAEAVTGARLEVLDGRDHAAPPEALATPIARFLAGLRGGTSPAAAAGQRGRERAAAHSAARRAR